MKPKSPKSPELYDIMIKRGYREFRSLHSYMGDVWFWQ